MQEISIAIQNELLHQNSKLKNQLKTVEQQLDNMLIEKQSCQQTIQEYTLIIKKKTSEAQNLLEKNQVLINQEQELYSRIDELEKQLVNVSKLLKQKELELREKPEPIIEYRPKPTIQKQKSQPLIRSVIETEIKECSECIHLSAKINELQDQIMDMDLMLKKTQDQYEELMQESYVSLNSITDQDAIGNLGLDFGSSVNSSPKSLISIKETPPYPDEPNSVKHDESKTQSPDESTPVKENTPKNETKAKFESKSENNTPSQTPKLRKLGSDKRIGSVSMEKIPSVRRFSDGPVMWPRFERKDGKIILKEFDERLKASEELIGADKRECIDMVDQSNDISIGKDQVESTESIGKNQVESTESTGKDQVESTESAGKDQVESTDPKESNLENNKEIKEIPKEISGKKDEIEMIEIPTATNNQIDFREATPTVIDANIFTKLQPVQSNVTLNEISPIQTESENYFGQVYQNVLGVSEQVSHMVNRLEETENTKLESDFKPESKRSELAELKDDAASPNALPKPDLSVFRTPEKKTNRSYSVQVKSPGKESIDTLNKRFSVIERHSIQLDDNVFNLNIHQITETPKQTSSTSETSSISAIVYAMQGSWFQKFNRNGNNPQLRFIKFDPYTPSIQWSKQIPNQNTKLKVAYVTGIEYGNIPTNRNYPPTNDYFILIQTSDRVIKIVPISWEIHEMWVKALKYILSSIKKHGGLRERVLLAREFCEEFSDSDDESITDKPRNRIKTVDVEMESVMSPQMRRKTSRPALKKFEFGFTPKKKFTEFFKVSK
ncbi:hypothetical protein HDV04_000522 [Boothiomyces sp. JEL0838]|nr:hypothetical protein HDV04_000522 [Boothiomyces sp. JEL0838]